MNRLLLSAALVALLSAPLAAQSRDGLWLSGGLGSGWTRVGCDICQSDRGTSLSGFLGMGGRVSNKVQIGAEANGWKHGDDQVDESVWGISAVAYVFPKARGGFFWKGGVGLLSYRIDDGNDILTSNALGFQLGAGWAFPLRGRFSITPYASAFVASLGSEVKFNGAQILDHSNLSLVQLGIGVTRR